MRETELQKRLNDYFEEFAKDEECSIEEAMESIEEDWGKEGLRGYGIFGNGYDFEAECICRIDEMDIYDSDVEAAKQAAKDGIKLIPWKEQPKFYPFNAYRFIDTPENRLQLESEAKRLKKEYSY